MAVNSIETKLEDAQLRGRRWLQRLELLERRDGACHAERTEAERKAQFWMARHGALAAKLESRIRSRKIRRVTANTSPENPI